MNELEQLRREVSDLRKRVSDLEQGGTGFAKGIGNPVAAVDSTGSRVVQRSFGLERINARIGIDYEARCLISVNLSEAEDEEEPPIIRAASRTLSFSGGLLVKVT